MFRRAFAAAVAATALTQTAFAADSSTQCGGGTLCPSDSPCCGQYGQCGVGAFCLGGCDAVNSHNLASCVPNPVCKSTTYTFKNLDDVASIDTYLGDTSKTNWQSQGKPVIYQDKALLLTLAEDTSGTVLSSTHYVFYGKVCAKLTTSQGKGVVTAFILMSDVKDEIDVEFVGVDIENTQSNFFSQGVTVYTNEKNLTVGNTVEQSHEYCIDWKEDSLTWTIDGKDARTLDRKDTWNATANRFFFPQTPSRIMLSLWPAGLSTTAKGTVDWAGGLIDWKSPYMQNGYYYAMVESVSVECYDPPSGVKSSKDQNAYKYTDRSATNNTIEIIDKQVVLGSLYASGDDPDEGASSASGAAQPTKSVAMVPGGNPGGGARGGDAVSTGAGASGTGSSAQSTGGGTFSQGNTGTGAGNVVQPSLGKVGGGAVAIVIALVGLVML